MFSLWKFFEMYTCDLEHISTWMLYFHKIGTLKQSVSVSTIKTKLTNNGNTQCASIRGCIYEEIHTIIIIQWLNKDMGGLEVLFWIKPPRHISEWKRWVTKCCMPHDHIYKYEPTLISQNYTRWQAWETEPAFLRSPAIIGGSNIGFHP